LAGNQAVVYDGNNGYFIGITPSGHAITLETDKDRNSAPTPIELLLVAVGACMGSDVVSILHKKREQLTEYRVEIQGVRRDQTPASYETIRLHHLLTGRGLSESAVQQAIELADTKYCSVAATLRPTAEVSVTYEILEAPAQLLSESTR
jgi:putative redox protein